MLLLKSSTINEVEMNYPWMFFYSKNINAWVKCCNAAFAGRSQTLNRLQPNPCVKERAGRRHTEFSTGPAYKLHPTRPRQTETEQRIASRFTNSHLCGGLARKRTPQCARVDDDFMEDNDLEEQFSPGRHYLCIKSRVIKGSKQSTLVLARSHITC